ncbi:hypothetical protein [Cellulomonas cellasea]|uniref:AbiEi antitoxin C-terminal domain-containing protein n=1 Tax=Cellulomonas cellasea TaxID=43670 RepID=A0A7W4YAV6_9CELL|nr:hypothetical protein [Cellulomonas cellasea]MBB2921836.1 hypothetical protein [Cellulomonas cellasea]
MRPAPWMPRPAPPLPLELRPSDVGPLTHRTLVRDGVATVVWGDLAVPADVPVGPRLRAAAFRGLVPARAVVGRRSAVWVHTGEHAPRRVDVLVGPRSRRPDPHPCRTTHECALPETDVVDLGGVRVTTVQRTGLDVARWFPTEEASTLLGSLLRAGFDPVRARADLARLHGYAGTLAAADLLVSLAPTTPGARPRDRATQAPPPGPATVHAPRQARIAGSSDALAPVIR